MPLAGEELIRALNNYLASMTPRQKETQQGLLLIDCGNEIARLTAREAELENAAKANIKQWEDLFH